MQKNKKILIVEDEYGLLSALSSKLEQLGVQVLGAQNGIEATKMFVTNKPDLVLLDILLPEKNGFEVLSDLQTQNYRKVPIIALSNLDQPQDIVLAKNLGAEEFLIKSDISLNALANKIQAYLSRA